MNELKSIASEIDLAGKRLETFANEDRNYNNIVSKDLEKMTIALKQMSRDLTEIKDYFFKL